MNYFIVTLHDQTVRLACNDSKIIIEALHGITFIESSFADQEIEIIINIETSDDDLNWSINDQYQNKKLSGCTLGDLAYNLSDCLVFHFADKIKDAFCIHAGAVVFDNKAFLIVGESGAGKSTFTAWLVSQGATYLTDELSIIDKHGFVTGLSRPIQIKWHGTDTAFALVDSKDNLIPGSKVSGIPISAFYNKVISNTEQQYQLSGIIFINYQQSADYQLTKLSSAEAGMKVMQNYVNARNVDRFGFTDLMETINKTPCYHLKYSNFFNCNDVLSLMLSDDFGSNIH